MPHAHPPMRRRFIGGRSGFTMLDLLLSMAVITVLMALLIPVMGVVRESTQRVACSSNLRQIGLGLQLYATDHDGQLPPSAYDRLEHPAVFGNPKEAVRLRLDESSPHVSMAVNDEGWDALGLLIERGYLVSHEPFYCPSHTAGFGFDANAEAREAGFGELIANYSFRVDVGSEKDARGRRIDAKILTDLPAGYAIVADSIRSAPEFNHFVGGNALAADLSVSWRLDEDEMITKAISLNNGFAWANAGATPDHFNVWSMLDRPSEDTIPQYYWNIFD